jgi:hypothetical protein
LKNKIKTVSKIFVMKTSIILIVLFLPCWLFSQQVADTAYNPVIHNPAYDPGKGPVVFIDEGHNNFHTKNGRYIAFSKLIERDGYVVRAYPGLFKKKELSGGKILVIANALNEMNVVNWFLPTPSAFTKAELEVVNQWVKDGGSLFLIADHMPMAGAAKDMAAGFGFGFSNGFAFDTISRGPSFFNLKEKTLIESIITTGRDSTERTEQIVTFTGQGFQIPADATPILLFNKNYMNMLPDTAWVFTEKTQKFNIGGWSQGAYKKYGKGRIVVFGEAAMFTAQLAGPEQMKVGMNSEVAPQNHKLLLNIIHWLDGKLE